MAKILLVEDDDNLREIYEARLLAEGYEIVTARNGEDALVVAKENKPDLIISDVMMPNISGFDMLDILRNTQGLHDAKVIMLTALSQADDKIRAEKLGADRYLVKSQVTLEDIVNTAAELLGIANEEPVATAEQTVVSSTPVAEPTPELTLGAPVVPAPVAESPDPLQQSPQFAGQQNIPAPVGTTSQSVPVSPEPAAVSPTPVTPAPLFTDVAQPAVAVLPTDVTAVAPDPAATQSTDVADTVVAAPPVLPTVTSTIPVVEPPVVSDQSAPGVISMPAQQEEPAVQQSVNVTPTTDPTPVQEPVLATPAEEPAATATNIDQPEATFPAPQAEPVVIQPAPISTPAVSEPEPATPPEFDPNNAQTVTSEGAAIQQQIDNFVSNAPIVTPEFNPASFEATNEQGEAETVPQTPVVPADEQVATEPSVVPSAPVAMPATEQQSSAAAPSPATIVAPAPDSTPHSPTGGNKVIQPLASSPVAAGSTLDELLAKEEAASAAQPVVSTPQTIEPVPAPQLPQQPVQAPAQPTGPTQAPQTTVFDPDDPSSVSL